MSGGAVSRCHSAAYQTKTRVTFYRKWPRHKKYVQNIRKTRSWSFVLLESGRSSEQLVPVDDVGREGRDRWAGGGAVETVDTAIDEATTVELSLTSYCFVLLTLYYVGQSVIIIIIDMSSVDITSSTRGTQTGYHQLH